MKKQTIALAVILLIATFLRFWQLGQNPPSLTWDEVAWGYNAYSLGIDGRDEFGRFLPLDYLESFGDFKPPVYAYLDILPIKIFGLNEFAVRFPSAFFGTLTVLITYFLTKRIFSFQYPPPRSPSPLRQGFAGRGELIALLSALFLAISPWHINLSRAAFEANVATFFIVLGVFLFIHAVSRGVASFPPRRWNSIDTSGIYLIFLIISFVLSMYTFNTARIVAPLLVLAFALGFRKRLLAMKRQVLTAIVIGSIFIAPLAMFLLTPQAKLRFQEVNIFSDISVIERTNQEIANDKNIWWSKIIHNRRFAYTVEYLRHYFDNFNPGFLFIKGDGNPKFSTQDVGQMYLWDLPFFIAGILFLLRKKERNWWVIPIWLLIGIIPAATARETPHALRIEASLPTFQILTAVGIFFALQKISNIKHQISNIQIKYLMIGFIFSFLIFNLVYYFHGYYAHYPREFSGEWQYGYKEAISYVQSVQSQYEKIVFTEKLGRPYIYFLFYNKENPDKFRQESKIWREAWGFVHVEGYGKYQFVKDSGSQRILGKKILFIDTSGSIPGGVQILKTFSLVNGNSVLVAYTL